MSLLLRQFAVTLGCLLLATAVAAQTPVLTPFEAKYKVRIKGLSGKMTMALRTSEDGFTAASTIKPRGIASVLARGRLDETSNFRINDQRVVPLDYTMRDTIARNDKSASMQFDWAAKMAAGEDDDGLFEHAIDMATYDRASIQYALMLDLLNGRSATHYTMLDGDRRKALNITHLGDSVVEAPYGKFTVRGVQHQTEGSSRKTILYCAAALGYLPVRIEQYKNDELQIQADLAEHRAL